MFMIYTIQFRIPRQRLWTPFFNGVTSLNIFGYNFVSLPLHLSLQYAINNSCNLNHLAIRVKINHQIKAPELRVITSEGENLGVMTLAVALAEAQKRSLDLIEISPTAVPPVAKIMDYGKYQYDEKKKEKAAKAKVQVSELKIVQIKIGTGEHDLELKAKKVSEWLSEGDRVKIDLFLIGRSKYMDINFLKERLSRVMKLITVEYKVTQDVTKGPKGLTTVIEKK
jgi:translation initiation factor IF-3